MKTVILVRHAKSSWKLDAVSDIYRPLNERGYKDAHELSAYCSSINCKIDIIYSSPAVRAYSTALYLSAGFDLNKEKVMIRSELYPGMVVNVIALLAAQKRAISGIMLVGHNDMMTELLKKLYPTFEKTMLTSTLAVLQFNTKEWKNIRSTKAKLLDYYVGGKEI